MVDAVPSPARAAIGAFLADLEAAVPDIVAGFHLVGSIAQGDYREHQSDIDFVAVLSRPAGVDDLHWLAAAHRLYRRDRSRPLLDGIWVTAEELATGPVGAGPATLSGRFLPSTPASRNPVTWKSLESQGITIFGTPAGRMHLWSDPVQLATWTRANVADYWAFWHARASPLLSRRGLGMLGTALPMWGVLGISRLHYTLSTGEIASKTAAGLFARRTLEARWTPIIDECLRIRRAEPGSLYANFFERRRKALAFVGMMLEKLS